MCYLTFNNVLGKILNLKQFIKKRLTDGKVSLSNISIERLDNGKPALKVKRSNKYLCSLKIDVVDISNTGNEKGLHLNPRGSGKLTINLIKKIKNLRKN